ncbi:MAG TPA: hypothetical protein VID30_01985 [Bradyrhizobium sp.]
MTRFALADDHEDANGDSVMSYFQAQQHALKMARGTNGNKPVSIAAALDAYEADLTARGGSKYNAVSVRNHCSPAMLRKVVGLLSSDELRDWHSAMIAKGLKVSSANRIGKSLKAALALAGKRGRLSNQAAWRDGLKPLRAGTTAPRDNYFLPDAAILAVIRESYADGDDFGTLIDVMAGTGARESQLLKLRPQDILDDEAEPRLMVWCSNKGAHREPEQRMLSITPRLAKALRTRALARGQDRPLFDRVWGTSKSFRVVLERLGLDLTLSPYVMRHSSIIRQIRAGKPLRFIAFDHDTSTGEIERTYARHLNGARGDLSRQGLLADEATPASNVVSLAR